MTPHLLFTHLNQLLTVNNTTTLTHAWQKILTYACFYDAQVYAHTASCFLYGVGLNYFPSLAMHVFKIWLKYEMYGRLLSG